MKYFALIYIGLALIITSCNNFLSENKEGVIFSYDGNYLTINDIKREQIKDLDVKDSIAWVDNFKKQWLINQVMIKKAEKILPAANKDISVDLLQYKADLLKYQFEDYYLKKKINTKVTRAEVEDYYFKNKESLITLEPIVKAIYIEFPNTIKKSYKVKHWLASSKEKDQEKLKNYCYQNAKVFDDFDDNWVRLSSLRFLTKDKGLTENGIILNKVIEYKNDSSSYYILINKLVKRKKVMPLEYAKDEVASIIINKRKRKLLEELDFEINQTVDALINKK